MNVRWARKTLCKEKLEPNKIRKEPNRIVRVSHEAVLKGKGDWTSVGKMKLQCGIEANIIDLYAKMHLLSFLLMCFLF